MKLPSILGTWGARDTACSMMSHLFVFGNAYAQIIQDGYSVKCRVKSLHHP